MTLLLILFACSTPEPSAAAAPGFVCPMDADVHAEAPGKCPKCGMDLVPVTEVKP